MDVYHLFPIFLVGIGISAFGNMIGFGGGVFLVPALVTVFGIPIHQAVGISILSILPAALIATVENLRKKRIDVMVGIVLEIPTAVGTVLGSVLCSYMSSWWLKVVFASIVFLMAVGMFLRECVTLKVDLLASINHLPPVIRGTKGGSEYAVGVPMAILVGVGIGVMAGLLGIGGGFLKTPVMVMLFGIPTEVAVATSLFMITFTSGVGSISHAYLGNIYGVLAVVIPISFAFGSVINIKCFRGIKRKKLNSLIGVGLLISGVIVLLR